VTVFRRLCIGCCVSHALQFPPVLASRRLVDLFRRPTQMHIHEIDALIGLRPIRDDVFIYLGERALGSEQKDGLISRSTACQLEPSQPQTRPLIPSKGRMTPR
jgi:hypothetical protein